MNLFSKRIQEIQNPDMDLLKGMQNPEGLLFRLQGADCTLQVRISQKCCCKLSQEIIVVGSYIDSIMVS